MIDYHFIVFEFINDSFINCNTREIIFINEFEIYQNILFELNKTFA